MANSHDSLKQVQSALYATLNGDATLTALAPVYDEPPESTAFPYITIGEATEVPMLVFGQQGRELLARVHVWSRFKGNSEALGIVAEINNALDRASLAITGYTVIRCVYEDAQTMRDPDGITRHVVARFRITVQN